MREITYQFVLEKRATPQPIPMLWPNGDCGACVLSGLSGLPVEDIYGVYQRKLYEDHYEQEWTNPSSFSPNCMKHTLGIMEKDGAFVDIDTGIINYTNPIDYIDRCWGIYPDSMSTQWWKNIRTNLESGRYAIAMVNIFGNGRGDDGLDHQPDHWHLIVGARSSIEWMELPSGSRAGRHHEEILISCSSTKTPDEEWVDAKEYIRQRGGFYPYFVKP